MKQSVIYFYSFAALTTNDTTTPCNASHHSLNNVPNKLKIILPNLEREISYLL